MAVYIHESLTVNYDKIKYDSSEKEIFDKCVSKFKKRTANIINDIIDQLFSKIQDYLDEDDSEFVKYNSKAKVKSKAKVDTVQFEKSSGDTYDGVFNIFLDIGSDMFGDQYIIAYVSICKDGKETIFHKDYGVNVEVEG